MPITLLNNTIQLEINEPGENYRGSRFDWTGQITQILYKNKHTFCTNETTRPEELNILGRGLYNEFGIDAPVDYLDCPLGGKFHKIGVGLLTRKTGEPYDFFTSYEVAPAEFTIQKMQDTVSFEVNAKPERGYCYKLLKTITLSESSFIIRYELTNTGEQSITTNEYVHNFLAINHKPIDANCQLKFPFVLNPQTFGAVVNSKQEVYFDGNSMRWNKPATETYYFSHVNPPDMKTGSWILENQLDKIEIRESVNFNLLRINVWGTVHVVSPEIFYPIDLLPGASCNWERKYEIIEL